MLTVKSEKRTTEEKKIITNYAKHVLKINKRLQHIDVFAVYISRQEGEQNFVQRREKISKICSNLHA
jgi:hypothetical protein